MNINTMSLKEIWQAIESETKKHPENIEDLNAVYDLYLTGKEEAIYRAVFNKGRLTLQEGSKDDADCILSLSFDNFKKLLQGNLNTTTAFMTGKVKVKGNIGLALKLEQAFKKFSF